MTAEICRYVGPIPDVERCHDCGKTQPWHRLYRDERDVPLCASTAACERRQAEAAAVDHAVAMLADAREAQR